MAYLITPSKLIRPITHALVNVPLPAYGSRLTLINGYPAAGGRDLGEMEDAPVIRQPKSWQEENSTTSSVAIDHYFTNPRFEIDVSLKRHVLENIKLLLNGEAIIMPDGSVSIGVGTTTMYNSQSLTVVWESRGGSGEFGYAMIYNAILASETEIGLSKDKSVVIKATFKGRPVSGRPDTFDLGEYVLPSSLRTAE